MAQNLEFNQWEGLGTLTSSLVSDPSAVCVSTSHHSISFQHSPCMHMFFLCQNAYHLEVSHVHHPSDHLYSSAREVQKGSSSDTRVAGWSFGLRPVSQTLQCLVTYWLSSMGETSNKVQENFWSIAQPYLSCTMLFKISTLYTEIQIPRSFWKIKRSSLCGGHFSQGINREEQMADFSLDWTYSSCLAIDPTTPLLSIKPSLLHSSPKPAWFL